MQNFVKLKKNVRTIEQSVIGVSVYSLPSLCISGNCDLPDFINEVL
jgi:hypothetical protein